MKKRYIPFAPIKDHSLLSFIETSSLLRLKNPEVKQSYHINFLKYDKEGMYVIHILSSDHYVSDCTARMKMNYKGMVEVNSSYVVFGCVCNGVLEVESIKKVDFLELCMWILD